VDRAADVATQGIEHRDRFGGAASVRMNRSRLSGGMVEHDTLGDWRQPKGIATDDSSELVDSTRCLGGHRWHAIQNHTRQSEIRVRAVANIINEVRDAADAS
jgi:hypothetical protein